MSKQQSLVQLPLIGIVLLCLLVVLYLMVNKRAAKRDRSAKIITHTVDTHADDALKYWTADKMRNAKGAKMPNVKTLDGGKEHPQRPSV